MILAMPPSPLRAIVIVVVASVLHPLTATGADPAAGYPGDFLVGQFLEVSQRQRLAVFG